MRIGIDARLVYYRQAGISLYIRRLVEHLPAMAPGVDWAIIQSRKDAKRLADRPVRAWTPSHHLLERWALGAELFRHQLDLLHSPDFIPPAFGARRTVITVHDLNFLFYPQFLTRESIRYYAGQIRWAVGRADHILADSHQTRQDLLDLLQVPPEKVSTVHLAADERFRPLVDSALNLDPYDLEPGYLLFVGTLEPRKNIPTLLGAFHSLRERGIVQAPLVLVGQRGWLAEEIYETIDTLGLEQSVRILTQVQGGEALVQLYNGASLLVLPSYYEGFGLPVLEAMACGTPVVASRRGSLPEVAGDAGVLIDPEEPDEIGAAVERILTDDVFRTDRVEKGFRQAAKFSWADTARRTLDVYERVLNVVP